MSDAQHIVINHPLLPSSGSKTGVLNVYDYSRRVSVESTPVESISVLLPIFSGEGPHKQLIMLTSADEAKATFGDDVFSYEKYGINAVYLSTMLEEGGNVLVQRIMPDDAEYSSLVLEIGIKKETTTVPDPTGTGADTTTTTLKYKRRAVEYDAGYHSDDVAYDMNDGSGWMYYPIMLFRAPSIGAGGRKYAIKITSDYERDNQRDDGRRYSLRCSRLLDTGGGYGDVKEEVMFSMNPVSITNPLYATVSDYIIPQFNTEFPSTDSARFSLFPRLTRVFQESYITLLNDVNTLLLGDMYQDEDIIKNIDAFFFKDRFQKDYQSVAGTMIEEDADSENWVASMPLKGGSNGRFDVNFDKYYEFDAVTKQLAATPTPVTSAMIKQFKEELLIKFYKGEYNPFLKARVNAPYTMVVDTYFSQKVSLEGVPATSKLAPHAFIIKACPPTYEDKHKTFLHGLDSEPVQDKWFGIKIGIAELKRYNGREILVPGTLEWISNVFRNYKNSGGTLRINAGDIHGKANVNWAWLPDPDETKILNEHRIIYPYAYGVYGANTAPPINWASDRSLASLNTQFGSAYHSLLVSHGIKIVETMTYKYTMQSGERDEDAATEMLSAIQEFLPEEVNVELTIGRTKRDRVSKSSTIYITFQFGDLIYTFNIDVRIENQPTEEDEA